MQKIIFIGIYIACCSCEFVYIRRVLLSTNPWPPCQITEKESRNKLIKRRVGKRYPTEFKVIVMPNVYCSTGPVLLHVPLTAPTSLSLIQPASHCSNRPLLLASGTYLAYRSPAHDVPQADNKVCPGTGPEVTVFDEEDFYGTKWELRDKWEFYRKNRSGTV